MFCSCLFWSRQQRLPISAKSTHLCRVLPFPLSQSLPILYSKVHPSQPSWFQAFPDASQLSPRRPSSRSMETRRSKEAAVWGFALGSFFPLLASAFFSDLARRHHKDQEREHSRSRHPVCWPPLHPICSQRQTRGRGQCALWRLSCNAFLDHLPRQVEPASPRRPS